MGSFSELLLDFDFRHDVPEDVLAAFASAKQGDIGPDLPPPCPLDQGWAEEWDYPWSDWEPNPGPRPPWVHDWGYALAVEYGQAYMPLTRPAGCALTWSPTRNLWHLDSLGVIKAGPEEYLALVSWIAPFACPSARPDAPVRAGTLRYDPDPTPVPILHDGTTFTAPGLDDLDCY